MKPLNEAERKKATMRFIGMYAVSLLLVLLLSFFLFSTPVKMYRKEASNYNALVVQYNALNEKTGRATSQINDMVEVEKVKANNPSATAFDSLIASYKEGIRKELVNLKNDSANGTLPLLEKDLHNYLAAFDAVLFYSDKNRPAAGTIPPVVMKDNDKNKFISELQAENLSQKNLIGRMAEEIKILKAAGGSSPAGSGASAVLAKLTVAEKERDKLQAQVRQLQDNLRTKDAQVNNYEEQVVALNNRLKNAGNSQPLSEEEKAKILYQSVDQVIRASKSEKKGVYKGLKNILVSIQNTYPDKNQVNQKIRELNAIISQDF